MLNILKWIHRILGKIIYVWTIAAGSGSDATDFQEKFYKELAEMIESKRLNVKQGEE